MYPRASSVDNTTIVRYTVAMKQQWVLRCQDKECTKTYTFGNEYTQYENAKVEARTAGWAVGVYCEQTVDLCPSCSSKGK